MCIQSSDDKIFNIKERDSDHLNCWFMQMYNTLLIQIRILVYAHNLAALPLEAWKDNLEESESIQETHHQRKDFQMDPLW